MIVLYLFVVLELVLIIAFINCDSSYDAVWENIQCSCNRVSDLDVSSMKVYVYNYAVEPIEEAVYFINDAADSILNRPDFDPQQCIDIFVLGYDSDIFSNRAETARCVLSQITCEGKETLAILLDHSEYSTGSNNESGIPETYKKSVHYSKSIGLSIGDLIVHLLTRVSSSNINIIGHGLGGHIVGYAAERVKDTVSPLPIIYVSDPAGPCFKDCPGEHVRSGQANVVVSFHCTDVIGTKSALADYDFYANDGKRQEGCDEDVDPLGKESQQCSHYKCVPISLSPSTDDGVWQSKKCTSYSDYDNGFCDTNEMTQARYRSIPATSPGTYYFITPPYPTCDKSEL